MLREVTGMDKPRRGSGATPRNHLEHELIHRTHRLSWLANELRTKSIAERLAPSRRRRVMAGASAVV